MVETIRVTQTHTVPFFIRTGRQFLHGTQGTDDKPGKDGVDVICFSALGDAINVATAAAAKIEKENIGIITKIETGYPDMSPDKSEHVRGVAQILITMKRNPKYVPREREN